MRRLLYFVIILGLLMGTSWFAVPRRYNTAYPKTMAGPEFDPYVRLNVRTDMHDLQPPLVFMGDSILYDGVDLEQFNQFTGIQAYEVVFAGSASALWYLILKNGLLASDYKPPVLVILFRDTMITTPDYRVNGRYYRMLDEFATDEDTLALQLAYINSMSPIEQFADRFFPLYGQRLDLRDSLEYRMKNTLPAAMGCGEFCVESAMDEVFPQVVNLALLNQALGSADDYLYETRNLDFKSRVDESFLPEIIRLCHENGVELVLVRAKVLRFQPPYSEPPALKAYVADLQDYLEDNDVPFLDYSYHPDFGFADYKDIIHMNEAGGAKFTAILAEDLMPFITAGVK